MKIQKRGGMATSKLLLLSFAAAAVFATSTPNANAAADVVLSNVISKITISGDLRIRHEDFHKSTPGQVDRLRERFRVRLNTNFDLPRQFAAKFTFASGTGEQVSTNQSFDNMSSQKDFWIDKAYLTWAPLPMLNLQAGRMANPLWTQYSSDVVWDGDFNPEGFSIGINKLVGPVNVFANSLAMVVDEDSGNNNIEAVTTTSTQTVSNTSHDQWMMANQIGVEFKLPLETRFRAAYANYDWKNERNGTMSQVALNEGNRRHSTGALVNNFNVDEFTGVLSGWIGKFPVQVQGTIIKNKGARDILKPKEDKGSQAGVIFGKAKEKHTFEVAYFRKIVQTDATVADLADSDFGDGGTNREGHIVWVAYAPDDWMLVSVKYFNTQVINPSLAPGRDDIRRTQVDFSVKF